jgi:sugar phosphate isomerase/epimerase
MQQGSLLTAGIGLLPGIAFGSEPVTSRSSMGVAGSSYANRWRMVNDSKELPGIENALQMLMHCESIGAGGIQVSTGNWTEDFSGEIRDFRENKGLYIEGSIRLPQDDADIERFETEVTNAKEAGAEILRTACLSGRRYENFETGQAFEEFKKSSIDSIWRALPVLEKSRAKLAIENHKDWRVPDLLAMLKLFDSEWIGINLDTGNNISFLEDPMYVVESLAPYSFTTHIKDMGIQSYEDGFLLSEVPLGTGQLKLKEMIDVCRKYNPDIRFNLEMITRDPLKVPCYTEEYWATFQNLPASEVSGAFKWIRDHQSPSQLPSVEGLTNQEKLSYEEENIISSFNFAIETLNL